ncbi:MAG: hypothetical protein GWN62_25060, partial [Aliifodinibius sp.]|nr:hypothetical protein [Fodinibius sp.]
QKALKRLDEKIAVIESEQAEQSNTKIREVKDARDASVGELEERRKEIEAKFDEEIAEKLDPIIKAGQRLEQNLQDDMGSSPKTDIHFPDTEIVVVKSSESIANKHISKVQKIVKDQLEELERG